MKDLFIGMGIISVILLLGFGIGYSFANATNPYKAYYNATEELLDTLDNEYNWVDSFDPYEYYDAKKAIK